MKILFFYKNKNRLNVTYSSQDKYNIKLRSWQGAIF